MRVLLDTHAVLWWTRNDPRFGTAARRLVLDERNTILVSVVSMWETLIKIRVGKLKINLSDLQDAIDQDGFQMLSVSNTHVPFLARLPFHHRDPFDHMLMAQAIAEDALFLSDDRHVPSYPVRHARCGDS